MEGRDSNKMTFFLALRNVVGRSLRKRVNKKVALLVRSLKYLAVATEYSAVSMVTTKQSTVKISGYDSYIGKE